MKKTIITTLALCAFFSSQSCHKAQNTPLTIGFDRYDEKNVNARSLQEHIYSRANKRKTTYSRKANASASEVSENVEETNLPLSLPEAPEPPPFDQ